jgi:membrane-bound lytic murein transglycosylase A
MKQLSLALLVAAAACSSPPEKKAAPPPREVPVTKDYTRPLEPGRMALEKITDPAQIPDFGPGLRDRERLLRALDESVNYYRKPSSKKRFPYLTITHAQALGSLERFREILAAATDPVAFHRSLVAEFDVYRSVGCDGAGTVFFTGYCEPIYDGSLTRTEEFRYPLYGLPPELVKDEDGTPLGRRTPAGIVDWPAREAIEPLLRGLEIAWLRDPFEAYIVHVQGSATIRLAGGKVLKLGYAGKTERPYRSAGLALVEAGRLKRGELSLAAMKRHFKAHPEDLSFLNANESYVFFRPREGGPQGSIGAEVTPLASLATDKAVFPAGALAFLRTTLPGEGAVSRFALDQDTGGAIRSAGRADYFIGTGPEAEALAGTIGAEGRLYYLFLKADGGAGR